MFVKGSLSFDLNGVKCTRKIEKTPREVLSYNVKIRKWVASKSAKKPGIFELFWPLMSFWRMRNELHKYKQLLRYQGSRVLQ